MIAFSAHRTSGEFEQGSAAAPLIFDLVDFVIGPGYNAISSVFTAPVSGLYFFTSTLNSGDTTLWANISVNGSRRRNMNMDVLGDTVSTSGILQLQVGDVVSVDLLANEKINCASNVCHFDGYLLYESL